MKKTLKTVGICVLITTFITSIIYFALISYLNGQILNLWFDTNLSINKDLETSSNTCRDIENTYRSIETNALDSFESYMEFNQNLQLSDNFPKLGLGLANSILPMAFSFTRYLTLIFILAIVSGIAIGLLIDVILIKKKKGKKLLFSLISTFLICLITVTIFTFIQNYPIIFEVGIIELILTSLSTSFFFTEFFLLILLIVYIGNFIQQLINIKRLNKELNKDSNSNADTQKLKNKIILLISIPLVFIILLATLDYFLPYSPFNGIIYNSFIIETLVDFIENIFSFFESIYYEFFPIQIGG